MVDQNSASRVRPEDLRSQLGIKKDTYYEDMRFLGLKAHRDEAGKAYLDEQQVSQLKALRSHVEKTGKRDGFSGLGDSDAESTPPEIDSAPRSELAPTRTESLASTTEFAQGDVPNGVDLSALMREAAELKGEQLALPDLVKLEIADRMTYDDLPTDVQDKVQSIREAAHPKHQPGQLADRLLDQWRSQRAVP